VCRRNPAAPTQRKGRFETLAGLLLLSPIAQDQGYHQFDERTIFGIPNFWNVVGIVDPVSSSRNSQARRFSSLTSRQRPSGAQRRR
jgi:hypothetical protein